jgi:predicted Zn-dependent peptidase
LTKRLFTTRKSPSQIIAFQNSYEDVGVFQVVVIPRPSTRSRSSKRGRSSDSEVHQRRPDCRRVAKGEERTRAEFLRGLESNLGKANQLINGAVFYGNPGQFSTDYQKTLAVTAADVKRVANQYSTRSRIVLSVVPKGKRDQASKATRAKRQHVVGKARR